MCILWYFASKSFPVHRSHLDYRANKEGTEQCHDKHDKHEKHDKHDKLCLCIDLGTPSSWVHEWLPFVLMKAALPTWITRYTFRILAFVPCKVSPASPCAFLELTLPGAPMMFADDCRRCGQQGCRDQDWILNNTEDWCLIYRPLDCTKQGEPIWIDYEALTKEEWSIFSSHFTAWLHILFTSFSTSWVLL